MMNVVRGQIIWLYNDNAIPINQGRASGTVKLVAICQIRDVTVIGIGIP